jgi:salicylate hydroxylase
MAPTHKIRIAISGGGLAGAAAARALLRQPHLDIHIYESAPEFSERGQGIGMAVNAQRALKHLVGDVDGFFSRVGAVSMNSTRIMIVRYPQLLMDTTGWKHGRYSRHKTDHRIRPPGQKQVLR